MYTEIEGDIIQIIEGGGYQILAHCHDCTENVLGKNMSRQLNEAYHYTNNYSNSTYCTDLSKLACMMKKTVVEEVVTGQGFAVHYQSKFALYTLYTASGINNQSIYSCPFDYDAFRICLRKLKAEASAMAKILLPMLGCGSQKANWPLVKDIILCELNNLNVTIVIKK